MTWKEYYKIFNITFQGWTPLMMATRNDHEAVVKFLINHGASVNDWYNDGKFFI